MKEIIHSGIKDIRGKIIKEGDILIDNIPTKGIVKIIDGKYLVTSNYKGRDINLVDDDCDLLSEVLIKYNDMEIVGSIYNQTK